MRFIQLILHFRIPALSGKIAKAAVVGTLLLCGSAWAQQQQLPNACDTAADVEDTPRAKPPPAIPTVPVQERMSAELALRTYQSRATEQVSSLGAYSDTTIVEAVLPNSNQRGQFELRQTYVEPQTMSFTPICFVGDNFVKVNVIIRVLKSEADHARKQQGSETALNNQNYAFTFKGSEDIAGRATYVFQVKPRHKRPGQFKGRVLIDPYTGALVRAEGKLVKSPSWFIRSIEFVQEYTQIGTFALPLHLHAVSNVRIIGPVVVDVFHRDYEVQEATPDTIAADYAGR